MKKSELVALLEGLEDDSEVVLRLDVATCDNYFELEIGENNRAGDGEIILVDKDLDDRFKEIVESYKRDEMLDAALDILWRDAGVTEGDLAMAVEYRGDPVDYLAKLLGRVK